MGTSCFVAMNASVETPAQGTRPWEGQAHFSDIFPVFSRLSLHLVFLKSCQSQVFWGLGTMMPELLGDGCSSERVSLGLGSLHSRAVAPLPVLFPPTFIFPHRLRS